MTGLRCFIFSAFFLLCSVAADAAVSVYDARIGAHEARTRVVFELSDRTAYELFTLDNPYRTIIDIANLDWQMTAAITEKGLVTNIRHGQFKPGVSRLVIDLRGPVKVQQHFLLDPDPQNPRHRLVVDLVPVSEERFLPTSPDPIAPPVSAPDPPAVPTDIAGLIAASEPQTPAIAPPSPPSATSGEVGALTPKPRPKRLRHRIVIDPGHGGADPGASGSKVNEKDVVLAFSRELYKQLRATGRYDVYLTRDKDFYIPLRERVQIARRKKADLFISVHADSIKKRDVRGLSIYTLSETASDREAAALAAKENRSDIIAGIDFGDQPAEVTDILIDLAQRDTKNLSVKFAKNVVQAAKGRTLLLERTHRFAGFRVLRAPDVPSVLVELGFLTNRSDERQLRSSKWRRNVADSMVTAIDRFFAKP